MSLGGDKVGNTTTTVNPPAYAAPYLAYGANEAQRLYDIRKNRMNLIKESEKTDYIDLDKIKKEVEDAKRTFKKYNWPVIDVTRKSVEEIAASIIKIHEIRSQNE